MRKEAKLYEDLNSETKVFNSKFKDTRVIDIYIKYIQSSVLHIKLKFGTRQVLFFSLTTACSIDSTLDLYM